MSFIINFSVSRISSFLVTYDTLNYHGILAFIYMDTNIKYVYKSTDCFIMTCCSWDVSFFLHEMTDDKKTVASGLSFVSKFTTYYVCY